MTKLRPCPNVICDGKEDDIVIKPIRLSPIYIQYYIFCERCGAGSKICYYDEDSAIRIWNNREEEQ